ncbi:srs domain-containing protein [Neospora caninum Liverpool]|uniref:Srs domain-containing protein n=1 Tax=Neospora caninum (strain Liverpool) TaxID=572307 RepID=F0VA47_NEOCL|nr:srs domain-containing protein [Neospora caninum Liverpool]CBZ50536.1 srs domain-containing protein [Neospora caninum Liverpool]CEL65146.1 TPA: SRS domain-containing protein [Neospora caninum Liverpool]|eukprot:XP_003880569.1 srs domain-containing protein [Neospora caninum Liverpool]
MRRQRTQESVADPLRLATDIFLETRIRFSFDADLESSLQCAWQSSAFPGLVYSIRRPPVSIASKMVNPGRMQRRRGGWKSQARKLMAVCVGGVLLISSGEAVPDQPREGLLRRNLQDALRRTGTLSGPEITGQVATCRLQPAKGKGDVAAATAALTLSKENLSVTLQCSGNKNAAVPEELEQVCKATTTAAKVAECKTNSPKEKQITLKTLLGTTRSIQWEKTNNSDNQGERRTLTLQESDLPLTDKAFFVGCDENNQERVQGQTECKVNVNVKARASSVGDGNVVTCAYGKDSNPKPLEVEMSTENNALTIDCGSEGSLYPTTESHTEYCDPRNKDVQNCTNKFVDILPTFVTSWWTTGPTDNSDKLTIPETDFPETDQQFRLTCVPNESTAPPAAKAVVVGKGDDESPEQAGASTSNCSVIVTVKTSNLTSIASSTAQIAAVAGGVAALTGFLVNTF